ncbi:peptide-binding protein [Mucilaginibacter ginsenosidivorans]|uniref:Peptide-binding protein n=1 Tax=Mucilaginibacter ginsenosidivorans TaxID=398053 RepID=A0A5B8USS8_9SPHI|nr:peptide-binding protein [Mucilaginibacter ginsenosidivorans]
MITWICFTGVPAEAQYFDLNNGVKSSTLHFRLIRNLVVIKLKINDKGPFNFILDTGVGMMVITDPKMVDSINLQSKRTIRIAGLGEGDDFEAYVTPPLKIDIPDLTSYDVAATMLRTEHFNLSGFVGIPIHGLLGYEFFNNLAVKMNFVDSTLTVYRPKDVRLFRRGEKIPITVEARKPYMQAVVLLPNGLMQQCKLIIDLGAGHPVSLENMIKKHGLPQKFIAANLGVGLAGPIFGFLSRIDEIDVGKYKIKKVITSFPNDYDSTTLKYMSVSRDGNLGIGLLKRFNVIFDYPDNAMYLKPNAAFHNPFEHDMSGIEYYAGGEDFKHIIVSRVEPGSSADEVGLVKDDEITAINFKPVAEMSLEEIDNIFRSKDGRNLLIEVFHDHKYDRVILTLKRRI